MNVASKGPWPQLTDADALLMDASVGPKRLGVLYRILGLQQPKACRLLDGTEIIIPEDVDKIVFGALPQQPSHGENRGSSPLGSANRIKYLIGAGRRAFLVSPIFLQVRSPVSAVIKSESTRLRIWGWSSNLFGRASFPRFPCDSHGIHTG
jgi:hypothetical protein